MSSHETAEKKDPKQADAEPAAPADVVVSNEMTELAAAQAQVAELKDRLLRAQAEWDNSRKRILKEKEEAVRYAGEALLERLLPVLDNFEMGLTAAQTANDVKAIAQGFEMVRSQLQQFLKDAGVEAID